MLNFEKVYNSKIIIIMIGITFFCITSIYPCPCFKENILRVPFLSQDPKNKEKIELVLLEKYYNKRYEAVVDGLKKGKKVIETADYIDRIKSRIIEEMKKKKGRIFVVAIDGNSGAFKTTSAKKLRAAIRKSGIKAVVIERDWFIKARKERYKIQDRELTRAEVSFRDNEISLRTVKFETEVLQELRNFKSSAEQRMVLSLARLYDKYGGGGLTHSETFEIEPGMVVIIEGNYLLTEKWKEYFDFKILMLANPSIGIERRLPRDSHSDNDRVARIFWRLNTPSFIRYLQAEKIDPDLIIVTDSQVPLLIKTAPSASRQRLQ